MKTIYDCQSHYEFLELRLSSPVAVRGTKKKFADFLRILPASLSQVLQRKYALNLEMTELACRFFDLSIEESDFFILLVNRDRAGSEKLRGIFDRQISEVLKRRLDLIERLGHKTTITPEAQGIYYSSWIYSAVHVCCTIPGRRSRRAIAEHLALNYEKVGGVLEFLESNMLVRKEGDEYFTTDHWIKLDKKSPHVTKLHSNWRQRAIQNLDHQKEEDLHFSGVFSIDMKTAAKLKENTIAFLQEQTQIMEKSPEKELFSIGIDFFKISM